MFQLFSFCFVWNYVANHYLGFSVFFQQGHNATNVKTTFIFKHFQTNFAIRKKNGIRFFTHPVEPVLKIPAWCINILVYIFFKDLRFHEHVNEIYRKVSKTISLLYPVAQYLPRPILDQIYTIYIRTHFDNSTQYTTDKLQNIIWQDSRR